MVHSVDINEVIYRHKKFTSQKRKRNADQDKESITQEAPACKRRQLKGFFRPWLNNEQKHIEGSLRQKPSSTPIPSPSIYHANMVGHSQTKRQRTQEQQRLDWNTLARLLSQRARQAQDAHMALHYEQYCAQQAAILEQQVRFSLYYRQLLQQAVFQPGVWATGFKLPQQQQQFLQQMALSQQLLIFGSKQ